ncbi:MULTISPECIES: hypothetical protein [Chryseobacterium]|jgi:hypothetical protein|uniref:hypothetical protein n=1 Tax=Chryseobacterium TaxID=59732 RepID=UPI0008347A76|nr:MULTISPECIES: hypothetical protein [Chryseobacterium]AZA56612.1 hypothetical protein EG350_05220 [Chryseobacterium shandongense]
MNTQTLSEKLELIQWLSTLEDTSIIKKLIQFRKEETKDWWDSISEEEKMSIEKGVSEADNDQLKSQSEARKLYGKWL